MSSVMSAISMPQPSQSSSAEVGRHRKPKAQVEKRTWGTLRVSLVPQNC